VANERVQEFHKLFEEIPWPGNTEITDHQQEIFQQGMDTLNSYRGDPDTLVEALKYFVGSGSRPYAFAGAANIMAFASFESDDNFDQDGLQEAMGWLKKAQAITTSRQEINVIEASILIRMKREEEARKILDTLLNQGATFAICSTHVYLCRRKSDISGAESWFERGLNLAQNDVQRLNLLNSMAAAYMMNKSYDKGIDAYEKVLKIAPKDPWAWHNISVMLLRQKKFDRAMTYNQKALSIMNFGAAQEVTRLIKKRMAESAAAGSAAPTNSTKGAPPAPVNQPKPKQEKGWFKKLLGG
jgi:tetratricopeptide (TPR) repeat protein